MTITGTNFLASPTVTVGGSSATSVSMVNSTTITATFPSHAAGTYDVVVTNTDGQSATKTGGFTYNAAPTVTSVAPSTGNQTGGDSVTITGTGFLTGATVSLGGSAATSVSVVNSTTITAITPAHAIGAVTVTVTNTDSQSGSKSSGFTYYSQPTITSVSSPACACSTTTGLAGVVLTGTNFDATTTVTVGGNAATITAHTYPTSLTVTVPAGSAGNANIAVTNSNSPTSTLTNGWHYYTPVAGFTFSPSTFSKVVHTAQTLTIQAVNSSSAATNVITNTTLTLSDGGHGGTFTPSSATINAGSGSTTITYQNNTPGTYTLTAHNGSYTDATATATITADAPISFQLTGDSSVTASNGSGTRATLTLTLYDQYGNVAIAGSGGIAATLSGSATGSAFYAASTGGSAITSTTIANGSPNVTFYYAATGAGTSHLSAVHSGFTTATKDITVNPAALSKFVFSPSSTSTTAGVPTTTLTITAQDAYNNPVTTGASLTLSDGGHGGTFSPSSAVINSGSSSTTVTYQNNTAGTYTLTATDSTHTAATMSVTVNPASSATYYYITAPASGTAGSASSAFTVGAHDAFGNVVTAASNTTVYLYSSSGTGTFATSSGGPYTATSVTILSGNTSANFYYKDNTAGSYTLTASDQTPSPTPDTGITNATTSYTVNAAAVASFVFTAAPGSGNASAASSAFTVQARDAFGNVVTVGSPVTVYLYSSSGSGRFASSPSGPWTATSVTITTGHSSANFYYQDPNGGTFTLTASDHSGSPDGATGVADAGTSYTILGIPSQITSSSQLSYRKITLGTSKVSDNTADISWHSAVNATVKAIRIQLCTTPLKTDYCVLPTGASLGSSTLTSTGGQLGSGWTYTINNVQEVILTKTAGAAVTSGSIQTVSIDNFVNPSVYGTFYFRVTTYSDTSADPSTSLEYGAFGASTAKSITAVGDVGETLVFRVANAVASDCTSQTDIADPNDTTEDLVTLAPSVLSLASPSVSTAQFCANTNAQHGYVIAYKDEGGYLSNGTQGFWNGAHEFGTAPSSGNGSGTFTEFTSTPGTEQFGFNLRDNITFGFDPDGNGLVADLINADYATVSRFSYNDTGAAIPLASKSSPNDATARYTISYLANINALTPGGTYQAHQVFVATATF